MLAKKFKMFVRHREEEKVRRGDKINEGNLLVLRTHEECFVFKVPTYFLK